MAGSILDRCLDQLSRALATAGVDWVWDMMRGGRPIARVEAALVTAKTMELYEKKG